MVGNIDGQFGYAYVSGHDLQTVSASRRAGAMVDGIPRACRFEASWSKKNEFICFQHICCMLWILSGVWIFLLSSPRFYIVVAHSERESFQQIPGRRFERHSGLAYDAKS